MNMMLERSSQYLGSYYAGDPICIPTLHHRFPEITGIYSIDAGFDQSPDLKKIYDHYTKGKPSVRRVVSQLSPRDFAYSATRPVTVLKKKIEYVQLLPSVVSVSSFYGVARTIDCSGLVIEWDATKNEAVILTSAKLLLCSVHETRENEEIQGSEGGPLITDDGFVVGINFTDKYGFGNPLPTPIILASLDLWKSYRTVVRPWFGFSVVDLHQLPPDVWERFNVSPTDSYVVVKEVYKGSIAYEKGVCPGDLVATCNGIAIHSAKQYLQLLFDRSCMVTASGDSNMVQQSFKVVIQSNDGDIGEISIEADNVAVVDKRFCECWPCSGAEWVSNKIGSQRNEHSFVLGVGGKKEYFS